MAIQNTTRAKTNWRFTDRKMLANVLRVTLIVLNCIYGIHVASSFAKTPSSDVPKARTLMKQHAPPFVPPPFVPPPFVPIDGKWNFKGDTRRSESNLVPLPESTHTLCNRIGASGSVQMEIVTLNSSRQQLLEYWRNAGWEVRPAPHQRSDCLACFCTKGDDFVYAWAEDKNGRIKSLMLVNHQNQDSDKPNPTNRNAQ